MVINYLKEESTRFLRVSNHSYTMTVGHNSNDCVLAFSQGACGEIATPYGVKKEDDYYTTEERRGFLKLKKVPKTNKFEKTVIDYENKGFSMTHVRDGILDPELRMPMLLKQPVNITEIIGLVKVDPRFLYQINPSLVKKEDMVIICEAASNGLKNILNEQSEMGIQYNADEHKERISFAETCGDALHKFQARWLELESAKNITNENKEIS